MVASWLLPKSTPMFSADSSANSRFLLRHCSTSSDGGGDGWGQRILDLWVLMWMFGLASERSKAVIASSQLGQMKVESSIIDMSWRLRLRVISRLVGIKPKQVVIAPRRHPWRAPCSDHKCRGSLFLFPLYVIMVGPAP